MECEETEAIYEERSNDPPTCSSAAFPMQAELHKHPHTHTHTPYHANPLLACKALSLAHPSLSLDLPCFPLHTGTPAHRLTQLRCLLASPSVHFLGFSTPLGTRAGCSKLPAFPHTVRTLSLPHVTAHIILPHPVMAFLR